MQEYSNPASRNTMRAAGNPMKTGAAIGGGGNATQGAGQIPGKVSVPMPGTNTTQPAYKGGMAKAPMGFNNGLIAGKI
ncbi:hypothetical protein UFOVP474_10 [uncultured Caudovirales phage]|jgi:hypothetical protein|uniref:Uncharacterized protein n=1 Tax=uncultured Caudovirales phage TaxID=2100421 RepID=A0A6J5R425_9CAUD|nr:hypothetical protein UFOVP474_10 [uncultured Caudovirales phage]CAB4189476.1 hypothetical protein UFOVP1207_6 [uncultured Caudovirales phage]